MSTCISRAGEYGNHDPGDWCPRCGAFNEEAIVAERDELRARITAALDECVKPSPVLAWATLSRVEGALKGTNHANGSGAGE